MPSAAFIYSNQLSRHVLRNDHPMRPVRLRYTYELLDSLGAFRLPDSLLVEPRPATEPELLTVHNQKYITAVRSLSSGVSIPDAAWYGFSHSGDNPIYPGMYEAALLSTGASLVAVEQVLDCGVSVAFNPAGGLHHAMPASASGFCIFNDPAIAIRALMARGLRVAYVDIDAHHGDGVQHAFYDTNSVLTISLHESGRYLFPGTGSVDELGTGRGAGYSVNVPLAPYTDDDVYLWAFQEVVPPLLGAFRPDALVTQLGIDTYVSDPITHLALTTRSYLQAVELLAQAARSIPWVALGGGGYDLSAVARCWALAYGVMAGQEWPDAVPEAQRECLGTTRLRDEAPPQIPDYTREASRRFAEATVAEVQRRVFPYHGL
ncbi:MAG: acetoin utilization protein AcuC [Dehalococcoidia bacterium]|nr:acetoin utilization protein AcuC [Dehalococcoidia bacterium]